MHACRFRLAVSVDGAALSDKQELVVLLCSRATCATTDHTATILALKSQQTEGFYLYTTAFIDDNDLMTKHVLDGGASAV